MKSYRLGVLALAVFASSLACESDSTAPARQAVEFPVHFTSVVTPESIGPHQVLVMKFSGDLGCDACYRFDRFEVQRFGASAEISARGIHYLGGLCAAFPARFENLEYAIQPPFEPGVFRVIVRQPDGAAVEREVIVRTS